MITHSSCLMCDRWSELTQGACTSILKQITANNVYTELVEDGSGCLIIRVYLLKNGLQVTHVKGENMAEYNM